MFSQYFIDKPRFAGVISIIMILLGLLAIAVLPVSQYPQITPPQIVVSTTYPGASAQVLVDTVAVPIENQINGVENMLYMSSTSDDNGSYTLTITFDVGTDPDIAQVKVQNRLQQVMSQLPALVVQEGVDVKTSMSNILGMLVLRSPNNTYNDLYLSNFAYTNIKNPISRIKGIGSVDIYGPQYSMRVWLNSDKIAALGIDSTTIANAISSQNIQASIGQIGAAPSGKDTPMVLSLTAKGLLNTVEDFENIVVATSKDGGIVRLKDVSRIELGADNYSMNAHFDNAPAVVIGLSQTPNTNSLQIMNDVKKEIEALSKTFPGDMELKVAYDSTDYVRASIASIIETLVITFSLVVLVTYIFLQKMKTTLIPLITIPVSLIATFAVIYVLGFDINILTLFAMILAIGLVVDDAIVVVERVLYLMETENLSPKDATIKAMEQVSSAVIATTLVLLAIFVPVGFLGGITGRIYQQFAIAISTAVFFSSVNALTLSPALCATMLKPLKPYQTGPLFWFNQVLNKSRDRYAGIVGIVGRKVSVVALLLGMLILANMFFLKISQTSFIPNEDQGAIFANIQLPEGASMERTRKLVAQIYPEIKNEPGVANVMSIVGHSILGGGGENVGFSVIVLEPWDKRTDPNLHSTAIMNRIKAKLSGIPSADINFFELPAIPGLGSSGGMDYRLQSLDSTDASVLDAALQGVLQKMNTMPEVQYAFTTYTSKTPQIYITIDKKKAESMGVPIGNIYTLLQNYLGSSRQTSRCIF